MTEKRKSPSPDSSSNTEEPECAGSQRTCTTSPYRFLKKLWKIVTSGHFQSIWWGDNGNCVVIAEDAFEEEVLSQRRPHGIFESKCMADFIAQLALRGFHHMEDDARISVSVEELRAIAAAGPSLGTLHFFYCPFFQRDHPNLLRMCKESPEERGRAPAAAPRSPKPGGKRKQKTRGVTLATAGGAEEEDGPSTSAASNITVTDPWADPDGPSTSAGPTPAKRLRSHSPVEEEEKLHSHATARATANEPRADPDTPSTSAGPAPGNDPWADLDSPSTSAGPTPAKLRRRDSPDGAQEAAPAPPSPPPSPSPPPQRCSPPAPLVFVPPPRPDGWPGPNAGQAPPQRPAPPSPPPQRHSPPALLVFGPPPQPDGWRGPNAGQAPPRRPAPPLPPPQRLPPPAPLVLGHPPGPRWWPGPHGELAPPPRPPRVFRHCPTCSCPADPQVAGQGDGR